MAYHKVMDVPAVSGLGITFSAEGSASVGVGTKAPAPEAPTAGQVNAFMDTIVAASKSQEPEPVLLPSPEQMAARTYGGLVKTTRFDISKGLQKYQQQSQLKSIIDGLVGSAGRKTPGAATPGGAVQQQPEAEAEIPWLWIGLGTAVVLGGGYLILRRK